MIVENYHGAASWRTLHVRGCRCGGYWNLGENLRVAVIRYLLRLLLLWRIGLSSVLTSMMTRLMLAGIIACLVLARMMAGWCEHLDLVELVVLPTSCCGGLCLCLRSCCLLSINQFECLCFTCSYRHLRHLLLLLLLLLFKNECSGLLLLSETVECFNASSKKSFIFGLHYEKFMVTFSLEVNDSGFNRVDLIFNWDHSTTVFVCNCCWRSRLARVVEELIGVISPLLLLVLVRRVSGMLLCSWTVNFNDTLFIFLDHRTSFILPYVDGGLRLRRSSRFLIKLLLTLYFPLHNKQLWLMWRRLFVWRVHVLDDRSAFIDHELALIVAVSFLFVGLFTALFFTILLLLLPSLFLFLVVVYLPIRWLTWSFLLASHPHPFEQYTSVVSDFTHAGLNEISEDEFSWYPRCVTNNERIFEEFLCSGTMIRVVG